MSQEPIFYATGKRKTAVARTWVKPGKGTVTINNLPLEQYFPVLALRETAIQALRLSELLEDYDIRVKVMGGGIAGQAGAVRHGITKALIQANPDLRQALKRAGFVKRDPRMKERKKYGQRSARARFQFSKR